MAALCGPWPGPRETLVRGSESPQVFFFVFFVVFFYKKALGSRVGSQDDDGRTRESLRGGTGWPGQEERVARPEQEGPPAPTSSGFIFIPKSRGLGAFAAGVRKSDVSVRKIRNTL